MDENTIRAASGAEFGRSLSGLGFNLLVRDVARCCGFLEDVLAMRIIRSETGFAIAAYGGQLFMLHGDATYSGNPLPSLLPEAGARGAGIELRFYDTDPDRAEARALARAGTHGCTVLRKCSDRPHGLRECYILDENGYCFVPSRRLAPA